MSEAQKAHAAANPYSPERLHQMSEASKAKWQEEEFREAQAQRWDDEARAEMAEITKRRWQDPEYRQRMSERLKGVRMKDGSPAEGFVVWKDGHIMLTMQQGHPLANDHGAVFEHRKVLYDDIGPGPHSCHWHSLSGCGKLALEWPDIHVDHVDDDPANNDLTNLVVSCLRCNWGRSTASWFVGEK